MTSVFLAVGLGLLILDQLLQGDRVCRWQATLTYYIYYFRPMFHRNQFFLIICLALGFSILINYLILPDVHILSHIAIFLLLPVLIYGMIFLLTLYDALLVPGIDLKFHFYSLEKDFIQLFCLGLFFPFIYLAFVVNGMLYLFRYPSQGIYFLKSFAGLVGLISFSVGVIKGFL